MQQIWTPSSPYKFESGKNKGKFAEMLMFSNPGLLKFMLNKLNEKNYITKNKLHIHLEWLLARGEDRIHNKQCRICRKEYAKYFSVRYSSYRSVPSFGTEYIFCRKCKDTYRNLEGRVRFFEFKWSLLEEVSSNKFDQRELVKFYREIFDIPTRLSAKLAFAFFSAKTQTPYDIYI